MDYGGFECATFSFLERITEMPGNSDDCWPVFDVELTDGPQSRLRPTIVGRSGEYQRMPSNEMRRLFVMTSRLNPFYGAVRTSDVVLGDAMVNVDSIIGWRASVRCYVLG